MFRVYGLFRVLRDFVVQDQGWLDSRLRTQDLWFLGKIYRDRFI